MAETTENPAKEEEECWREKEEEEVNLIGRCDRKDHEVRTHMGSVGVSTLPPQTSCSFYRKEWQRPPTLVWGHSPLPDQEL